MCDFKNRALSIFVKISLFALIFSHIKHYNAGKLSFYYCIISTSAFLSTTLEELIARYKALGIDLLTDKGTSVNKKERWLR